MPPCLEISLILTDDEGIRALNRQYRGIDKPTDVLSFPLWDEQPIWDEQPAWKEAANYKRQSAFAGDGLDRSGRMTRGKRQMKYLALPLGDIVISLPRAAAQAEAYGHGKEHEAVFLLVHGLLHLLGYDHERGEEEEKRMFARQKQIMNELAPLLEVCKP